MQKPTYYGNDLAYVHDRGFSFHADACAPGVLALLADVRVAGGLVVELGCGSGHLTRHLVTAGHRVVATDASPAMTALTQQRVHGADDVRVLVLPDDPIPTADAVVSVGHAVNYLPTATDVERAFAAAAEALRPGGVLVMDVCDLAFGQERNGAANFGRAGDDWAIVTEYDTPAPDRFVRQMAVFVRNDDGSWRRSDERHDNVLIDTARLPGVLAGHGVEATLVTVVGDHELPAGMVAVVGHKPPSSESE